MSPARTSRPSPSHRRAGDGTSPLARALAAARRGLALSTLVALAALLPRAASAQGFGVYEHGTCSMARGGATTAVPCDDGSAMFFNPAALAGMEGLTLSAGGTLISAVGDFTHDLTGQTTELQNDPIPVPHLYAAYGLSDRLAAGLGVFVPYGLGTEWPSGEQADFDGRFLGYDNHLQSIYIQPTVAYRVNDWLSVGAGLDLVMGSVELNQRLDLSQQFLPLSTSTFGEVGVPRHTAFADVGLESDPSWGIGGNFGVQFRAGDTWTVGAKYMTEVKIDYTGDADFTQVSTGLTLPVAITLPGSGATIPAGTPLDQVLASQFQSGGALVDQGVETSITMPDQFVLGLAVTPGERWLLEADWQWVQWSDFDRIEIDFQNPTTPTSVRVEDFRDTYGIRFGGEYEASDRLVLRAGYIFHTEAAPARTITPLLPEGRRNEFMGGLGWDVSSSMRVDVAYQFIAQEDRRGRVREAPVGEEPSASLNNGLYTFAGHLFGTTVTLHF